MAENTSLKMIDPAKYPGLRALLWNRDPAREISATEAFAIYERNWRHIDQATLTVGERRLIAELTDIVGRGTFLG